jgi:hypothetical protein
MQQDAERFTLRCNSYVAISDMSEYRDTIFVEVTAMGPWASAIVAVSSMVAVFFVVMAFRGLIEAWDGFSGRCTGCDRVTSLPVPLRRPLCWRCRHESLELSRWLHGPTLPRR